MPDHTGKASEELSGAIADFVRGKKSWLTLKELSIGFELRTDSHGGLIYKDERAPKDLRVTVTAQDVAAGFFEHESNSADLRAWAFLLLSASFIDFQWRSKSEEAAVLDALHTASFQGRIDSVHRGLIEGLLAETS